MLNVVLKNSLIVYLTYILTFEVAIQIRRNPSSCQKNAFESILLLMLAVVTSPSQTVYENLSHLHNLRSPGLLIWIVVNSEQVQANIKSNFDGILENYVVWTKTSLAVVAFLTRWCPLFQKCKFAHRMALTACKWSRCIWAQKHCFSPFSHFWPFLVFLH